MVNPLFSSWFNGGYKPERELWWWETELLKWHRKWGRVIVRQLIRNWEGIGRCWLVLCSCLRCWGVLYAFSSPTRRWRRWTLCTRSRWSPPLCPNASPTARSYFYNHLKTGRNIQHVTHLLVIYDSIQDLKKKRYYRRNSKEFFEISWPWIKLNQLMRNIDFIVNKSRNTKMKHG